ncbi:MAG: AsmA-like C-terminal region-containing protein [Opitutales bacterium]
MAGYLWMRRFSKLLEFCLDAFLLGLFLIQAFTLGCFLTLGYFPLPRSLTEDLVQQKLPKGFELSAQTYRLYPDGTIYFDGPILRLERIDQPVLECETARLEIDFSPNQRATPLVGNLLIAGGELFLPPTYSPNGQRLPLLESISARASLNRIGFTLESFAAKHRDVRVRGSARMPAQPLQEKEPLDMDRLTHQFFTTANQILEKSSGIEGLKSPTLSFLIERKADRALLVEARLTSREFNRSDVQARGLSMQTRLKYAKGRQINNSSLFLQIAEIDSDILRIKGRSLQALIEQEQWQNLQDGNWPDLELIASSLSVEGVDLKQPQVTLNLQNLPELTFNGTTSGLGGAVQFQGIANLKDRSANLQARGNMNLLGLVGDKLGGRLPNISLASAPYYDLDLNFGPKMKLIQASLRSEINDLTIEGIHFDHIRTAGHYQDGQFDFPETFIQRSEQWLKLGLAYDQHRRDYRLRLYGSVKPSDYSPILPRWWGPIFEDFDFEQAQDSLGDFIIYGNAAEKAAELFYGHAQAQNVSYKGVYIDQGSLRVRGRGPYAEIFRVDVRQPDGWARGAIRFSSRLDEIRGPASVRLDLDTRLDLNDARKLFDQKVSTLLDDFESSAPIEAQIRGALFNQAYPEFEGKSFMNIRAQSDQPLRFRKIALDGLSFELFGRDELTQLRDLQIGLAGGTVEARADITTPKGGAPALRFEGHLKDADQAAVDDLLADVLQQPKESEAANAPKKDGQLDLRLHAAGPIDQITELTGYGDFELQNERLASIQLFGPISKLLERTQLGYTTFALEHMQGSFSLNQEQVRFDDLRINGPRTRIEAPGELNLFDQSLNMRVSVYLFGNAGNPRSQLRKLTDFVASPVPNLLEFELTGTLQDQKWRSIYDPRNLLPEFLNPANL